MKLLTVRHVVPNRRITNADVLAQISKHNAVRWADRLPLLEERVLASLTAAGTDVRHALDDGETALELALRAGRAALAAAEMAPDAIDFLLYAGVGRGWIEPATAPAVQAGLGLGTAMSFDVMDACASWIRALELAHALIHSGRYRRGMIVNAECGLYRAYADWTIESLEELDYRLGTYTIGEAATATIVTDERPDDDFEFVSRTLGEHVDLCMIPLANAGDFLPTRPSERHVAGRFYALSRELFGAATHELVTTFAREPRLHAHRYDIAFGHDATARVSATVTEALGVADVYFPTHREYGNTVAASVPLGISLAFDAGKLIRGQRVLLIVGSAGLSIGFASFTF
jgi:3-oxoacyl-[acyl-carrier-protein] synthase III